MCQAEKKDCMSIKCRFLQKKIKAAFTPNQYDTMTPLKSDTMTPLTSTAQLPHSPSHFQCSTWCGMNAARRGSSTKVYLKSLQKIWMILNWRTFWSNMPSVVLYFCYLWCVWCLRLKVRIIHNKWEHLLGDRGVRVCIGVLSSGCASLFLAQILGRLLCCWS